ncbi:MAG TPA: hypothetical protein VKA74_00585, partial [Myxococcota bacterium]|nr:hypothetical protein [Myxococcota bacterium]
MTGRSPSEHRLNGHPGRTRGSRPRGPSGRRDLVAGLLLALGLSGLFACATGTATSTGVPGADRA